MFGTLLINQINLQDRSQKRKVFFLVGNMNEVRGMILDHFVDSSSKYCEDVTLSYNGISILIKTSEIPEAIRKFVNLGIDIYGVYELYEPK